MKGKRWLLFPAVAAAAFGFPHLYQSEAGTSASEQVFAAHAVMEARHLTSNPLEGLLIRRYVVQEIQPYSQRPSKSDCEPELQPYSAQVLAVGWFGVPVTKVFVSCDTASRKGVEET
ncbi:hypothetical protein [Deinococcus wulumuqiensis]|uniref:hypothetical protein n=1 Tax=Deinococcus wulumuqiensis TaxID=980427 RepID=UPI0013C31629|nr:hypothetical protein [Deinococcus wulumuqiensis]